MKSALFVATLVAGLVVAERASSPLAAQSSQAGASPAGAAAAGAPPQMVTFDTAKPVTLELSDATARYRVAEQLVGLSVLSDAVGTTNAVAGVIVIGPDGTVGRDSRITIDLRTFKSDQEPRDNYIRRTLDTDKVPMLEFVPTRTKGMPIPLPSPPQFQAIAFQLIGNLTLHGVTKEVALEVVAGLRGANVAGRATGTLLFSDFKIAKPAVPVLLSVDDKFQIEVEFRANRSVP